MDRMTALETFVTAIETGSFNRAARRINITQSAVSQQIKALEHLLGQELVIRSPQGVRPTEAGQITYDHAQEILRNYSNIKEDMATLSHRVSGTLRISVGSYLGKILVGPALVDLNGRYPELDLVIRLEDRLVDVVGENYDLAIRTGGLGETSGYSRKVATIDTMLFATPAYLQANGAPGCPADLTRLRFVQFNDTPDGARLRVIENGAPVEVDVPVALSAASPDLIMHAVKSGAGFSRAPVAMIQDQLADGTFVPVLPDCPVAPKPIHILYPSRRAMTRTLQTVVSALRDALAQHPTITLTRNAVDG